MATRPRVDVVLRCADRDNLLSERGFGARRYLARQSAAVRAEHGPGEVVPIAFRLNPGLSRRVRPTSFSIRCMPRRWAGVRDVEAVATDT